MSRTFLTKYEKPCKNSYIFWSFPLFCLELHEPSESISGACCMTQAGSALAIPGPLIEKLSNDYVSLCRHTWCKCQGYYHMKRNMCSRNSIMSGGEGGTSVNIVCRLHITNTIQKPLTYQKGLSNASNLAKNEGQNMLGSGNYGYLLRTIGLMQYQ